MASILGLAHIGVIVSDMDRSLAFYRDLLGMKLESECAMPNGTRLAFLEAGSCVIELIGRTDRLVPEKPGPVDHICVEVDDIDAMVDDLKAKGVQFLADAPQTMTAGSLNGVRNIFFTGPDGERIEFFDFSALK